MRFTSNQTTRSALAYPTSRQKPRLIKLLNSMCAEWCDGQERGSVRFPLRYLKRVMNEFKRVRNREGCNGVANRTVN